MSVQLIVVLGPGLDASDFPLPQYLLRAIKVVSLQNQKFTGVFPLGSSTSVKMFQDAFASANGTVVICLTPHRMYSAAYKHALKSSRHLKNVHVVELPVLSTEMIGILWEHLVNQLVWNINTFCVADEVLAFLQKVETIVYVDDPSVLKNKPLGLRLLYWKNLLFGKKALMLRLKAGSISVANYPETSKDIATVVAEHVMSITGSIKLVYMHVRFHDPTLSIFIGDCMEWLGVPLVEVDITQSQDSMQFSGVEITLLHK